MFTEGMARNEGVGVGLSSADDVEQMGKRRTESARLCVPLCLAGVWQEQGKQLRQEAGRCLSMQPRQGRNRLILESPHSPGEVGFGQNKERG